MAKRSLTVTLRETGLVETLKATRQLPKDGQNELRVASQELSTGFVPLVKIGARVDESPQTRLLIPSVKSAKDRVPVIQAGGTRRVGRNRKPAYKLLFGSVFGSNAYKQFGKPHGGRDAYWFFNTIEKNAKMISRAWLDAADRVLRKWGDR